MKAIVVSSLNLMLLFALPAAHAQQTTLPRHSYQLEVGAFDGRINHTQSNNTIPFNTSGGEYFGGELEYGGHWRMVLGGNYSLYPAKVVTSSSASSSTIKYGGAELGLAYATPAAQWRLIYTRYQVPYTDAPDPNTLIPHVLAADFVRAELILKAKAKAFNLELLYYLNIPAGTAKLPDGSGTMTTNYFLGGCARLLFGGSVQMGPSICLDLEDSYFPNGATVYRQEVHGRWTVEF